MPKYSIITLFPALINNAISFGVLGRAIEKKLVEIATFNPRDYSEDKHGKVDDAPYGGGPGMVMQVEPLRKAVRSAIQTSGCDEVIYLSPQGQRASHQDMQQLAASNHTVFICGRYEGIDQRIIDTEVTRELSVGDFVMSGGEFAVLCVLDAVTRLLPGSLGNDASAPNDSFHTGLLDFPQYTRPEEVDGQQVPEVLLSGDHKAIARWRRHMALRYTLEKRPDLLASADLDDEDRRILTEMGLNNL